MKVCMISGFANYTGGLENVVKELNNYLLKNGADVTLLSENQQPYFLPKLLRAIYFKRSLIHKIPYSFNTWLKLQSHFFDVIHGHNDNCFFPSLLRNNVPFIMTFHGTRATDWGNLPKYDIRMLPSFYAEKLAASKCDINVACCKKVKEEIETFYGSSNTIVIYNGVDVERFAPKDKLQARQKLNLPDSKYYAIWVGRDPLRKGLRTVLDTLKYFPDIHLIVIGCEVSNTKKLTCLGKARESLKVDAYNAADFFFFPTMYEGFPLVGLEAMSCGLPILVSKESNLGEIIIQGKHGFVVDDGNYKDKIGYLLGNLDMSINCRQLALRYSWDKQAARYLALYERLLV